MRLIVVVNELNLLTLSADLHKAVRDMPINMISAKLSRTTTNETILMLSEFCRSDHLMLEWMIDIDDFEHLRFITTIDRQQENTHIIILYPCDNCTCVDIVFEQFSALPLNRMNTEVWVFPSTNVLSNSVAYDTTLHEIIQRLNSCASVCCFGFAVCSLPEKFWDYVLSQRELAMKCTGVLLSGEHTTLSFPLSKYQPNCPTCTLHNVCTGRLQASITIPPCNQLFAEESLSSYSLFHTGDMNFHLNRYASVTIHKDSLVLCNQLYGENINIPLRGVSQYILLHMLERGVDASTIKNFLNVHTGQPDLFDRILQGCVIE